MRFISTLTLDGKTATGITVPEEVVAALGGGKRPRVRVTLNGYTYQSTVARMRGDYKIPVSAAVREQIGLTAGDQVEVSIALDQEERVVAVPADLAAALEEDPVAKKTFESLSVSKRKQHVLAVEGAKTAGTRERRISKVLAELTAGKE